MNSLDKAIAADMVIVPTQAGYDRWAEMYDDDDNPLILLEEEHIGALIGSVTGLTVADIGCGTGRHALRLAAQGARVAAVDFSEAMLARARGKAGAGAVTFVCHDFNLPLPLTGAAFDKVLCCLVLDHIRDLGQLFSEFRRLCHAGGSIIVSVMHPAMNLRGVQARFIDPGSDRRISPASYPHLVSDYVMSALGAGLVLEHLSEHVVDVPLVARSARAEKYLGWPLLLLIRFRPKPCP